MHIISETSKLLTVIPFIILKFSSKTVHSLDIENKIVNKVEKFHKTNEQKIIKGKWIYIIISGLINFVQSIFFAFTFNLKTNFWILGIGFTSLFYYLIF